MADAMLCKRTVEELENEIAMAEARLANLKTELKALNSEDLRAGKCRLKLMPPPYHSEKAYWSLGILAKASTDRTTYVSVFADRDKQKVIDAIGSIAADLTELWKRVAAQTANRKEEE